MTDNPLRHPQDRRLPRIPEPCALVIFGVTGDLARKKLIPAETLAEVATLITGGTEEQEARARNALDAFERAVLEARLGIQVVDPDAEPS